jgi:predicted ATP-dependent endonuclease of OLD family
MKLKRIYFDSFKSLIDEKIEFSENCVGIVGINESGKSNILEAIRALEIENPLSQSDSPKTTKSNPKIRFIFQSSKALTEEVCEIVLDWFEKSTLVNLKKTDLKDFTFNIEYTVEYNLETNNEFRDFKIIDSTINVSDYYILKPEFISSDYKFLLRKNYIPIENAIVLNKKTIEESVKEQDILDFQLEKVKNEILDLNKQSAKLIEKKKSFPENIEKLDKEIKVISEKLTPKYEELEELKIIKSEFNVDIDKLKLNIETLDKEIKRIKNNIKSYSTSVNALKIKEKLSVGEKSNLTKFKKSLQENRSLFTSKTNEVEKFKDELIDLETPLVDKYINCKTLLETYITRLAKENLDSNKPEVIFWKYSPEFILNSSTLYEDIVSKNRLSEISRPLANIFRVGLNLQTLDDIKDTIKKIQSDEAERSKLIDRLNDNLNQHIKNIWGDYDQEIKIILEESRIRIQFYDPDYNERSYFNMDEKSQGAQTFISFLMTIGAEAAKGVIKNKILLLDEPEIHLHPSGVRYMLKELIKISKKNNLVVYATHSIFMIDRDNFDRHVYLKKKNERTSINPSQINRIGFFMQEEVLHEALNIDLSKDFKSTNKFNFVFEGDGDVNLFKFFYENTLKKPPLEIKNCNFYQGGKCSDIQKYLLKNPIQLGTKWIFILDNDSAAKKLVDFITSKYKDYIDKDIYVFQYENEKKKDAKIIELEDLIPVEIIKESYLESFKSFKVQYDFDSLNFEETTYSSYNPDILDFFSFDKEQNELFKAKFKQILNDKIKSKIDGLNGNDDSFEETFNEFSGWANLVAKKIK